MRIDEPNDPELKWVSKMIPDGWIDEQWPMKSAWNASRCKDYRSSQLVRVHLLCLLKRLNSFNCVSRELAHNMDYRRFCRLRAKDPVPVAATLTKFRQQFRCSGWWKLHEHLVRCAVQCFGIFPFGIIVADATDLPATIRRTWKKKMM